MTTLTQLRGYINKMFSGLTFDDQRHFYFWNGEGVYKSVTGLVEDHAIPFDEAVWLPRCARKEGISEHELKHKWQTINKLACDLGSETHDFLERYTGIQTPSSPQQVAGIKFLKFILKDYEIVFRELRMYSCKYKYAGTEDLLLRHRVTKELAIADYKTNSDMFKSYGFLKPPFQYLENHPYSLDQLQLSYYQLMLEEINLEISERFVVHLKADETYRKFDAVDFTKELRSYLIDKEKKKQLNYAAW